MTAFPFPFRPALSGRWSMPLAALAGAAVVCAGGLLAHWRIADAVRDEVAQQRALQGRVEDAARVAALPCAPEVSYAMALPASLSLDRLVQALQDSTKAFNVALVSVASEPHPATTRTLPAVEVNVTLHGAYAGVKSALAEAMSRFPAAALERLRFKRDGAGALVAEEVTVQFVLPLRPGYDTAGCVASRDDGAGADAPASSVRSVP